MTQFIAPLRGSNFRPTSAQEALSQMIDDTSVNLLREGSNKFDANAIMVQDPESGEHIGYVAKEIAALLAPLMDEDKETIGILSVANGKNSMLTIDVIED